MDEPLKFFFDKIKKNYYWKIFWFNNKEFIQIAKI